MSMDWFNNFAGFKKSMTGSISDQQVYHLKNINFGQYEIAVIVDSDNRFVGIAEVTEKRDFLDIKQRISRRSAIDVDNYYKE